MILPVMIVKNEENTVRDTLLPFIKHGIKEYFILDTGSTDNTMGVIQTLFKEFNLKGTLLEEEFIDFATTRNRAIELAKIYYKLDFFLFLDAEWFIEGLDELLKYCKKEIYTKNEYYYITIKTPNLTYTDIRFFKRKGKKKFIGVVHEVMDSKTQVILPDSIYFRWNPCKESVKKSMERWVIDIKKMLSIDNKSSRDIFFIAETYYKLKDYKLAQYSFQERISMGGCKEEIYMSYYRLGNISSKIKFYLKSYLILPSRAEPLIKSAMIINDLHTKLSFLEKSLEIEEPKSLFVNSKLYSGREELIKYVKSRIYDFQINSELKYITVAILARNKSIFLKNFLKCLEKQTYPKEKILLYIRSNNNNDNTIEIIDEWLNYNSKYYFKVYRDYSDLDTKENTDFWSKERFKILAKIREDSIKYALENGTEYFTIDCDNFMHKDLLMTLYKTNLKIVSGYMISDGKYANFHAETNSNGYNKKCLFYEFIFNMLIKGSIEVPVVHCNYLIRNEILNLISYSDNSDRHEYVIFSDNCRKKGIKQHINNTQIWGYISFSKTKNELENSFWYKNLLEWIS